MAFKGLFVGIDKYTSPLISNLSCSVRDARAMYALFGDSFGTSAATLLVDSQANKSGVIDAIEGLSAEEEDVVVLAFSGHGSDSHHLITVDSEPSRLDETAIPLDDLTDLFAQIKAANVLLLLDCCFAGGAGARVFHAPVAPRDARSAEALLRKIAGRGRLIFTAASAEQEAIEDRRKGHGLFTFYVLEALRGAPEVVRAGKIPMLSLVDFVTRSVTEGARQARRQQEPGLRGLVDGELHFPVLTQGALFSRYFPDHSGVTVGKAVNDLGDFGFPPKLLDAWRGAIPSLNQLQQDAINRAGLFRGEHLVVSAPTSSGKTLIGELAALYRYIKGERGYMLFPLRALVNDKYAEFTERYAPFGLRIIRSTGEISDDNPDLLRGKFDIALLTYERFASLAVVAPHILRHVGSVVVDEVQMITDRNRGANLEFLLTLLKSQRLIGVEPQLIALSAVIGDTNGFESWLGARLLSSDLRPVPLDEGLIDIQGSFRFITSDGKEGWIERYIVPEYRKGSSQDIVIPLVRKLVGDGEKVIVFRPTRPIVRATARYLRMNLTLDAAEDALNLLPGGDPSAASGLLRECLEGGIAFHSTDLGTLERQAVEKAFRDPKSSLRVLVATTTVAMGVNTPAWSVIIAGLEHPDSPYTVAEYKNMAGRAGRLGFTDRGKSFLVAATPAEEHRLWENYVKGNPEALFSRFGEKDPLSLVCRVLATATASRTAALSAVELSDFIRSSFSAHGSEGQAAAMSEDAVRSILGTLNSGGLAEEVEDRFRLTELGKVAGELGIEVESVVRIARALRGLGSSLMTGRALLGAIHTTVELDDVIFPVHKTSVQERHRWQDAVRGQGLPDCLMQELRATDSPGYTTRCKRLAAVIMWLDGVEMARIEASLMRHLPGDNAAGAIKASSDRSRDLIGAVARIGSLVSSDNAPPPVDIDEMAGRLELGIPGAIVWLGLDLKGQLERGEYLELVRQKLETPEALEAADDATLAKIVASKDSRRRIREAVRRFKKSLLEAEDDAMPSQMGDL